MSAADSKSHAASGRSATTGLRRGRSAKTAGAREGAIRRGERLLTLAVPPPVKVEQVACPPGSMELRDRTPAFRRSGMKSRVQRARAAPPDLRGVLRARDLSRTRSQASVTRNPIVLLGMPLADLGAGPRPPPGHPVPRAMAGGTSSSWRFGPVYGVLRAQPRAPLAIARVRRACAGWTMRRAGCGRPARTETSSAAVRAARAPPLASARAPPRAARTRTSGSRAGRRRPATRARRRPPLPRCPRGCAARWQDRRWPKP